MEKMLKATRVVEVIVSILLAMSIIGIILCVLSTAQAIWMPVSKYASATSYYDVVNFFVSMNGFDIMGTNLTLFENAGDAKALLIVTNFVALLFFISFTIILGLICKISTHIRQEKTPFTETNCQYIFIIAIVSAVLSVVGSDSSFFFNLFIVRPFFGDVVAVVGGPLAQFRGLSYSPDVSTFLYTGIVFLLYYIFKYGLVLQKQDDELL